MSNAQRVERRAKLLAALAAEAAQIATEMLAAQAVLDNLRRRQIANAAEIDNVAKSLATMADDFASEAA